MQNRVCVKCSKVRHETRGRFVPAESGTAIRNGTEASALKNTSVPLLRQAFDMERHMNRGIHHEQGERLHGHRLCLQAGIFIFVPGVHIVWCVIRWTRGNRRGSGGATTVP